MLTTLGELRRRGHKVGLICRPKTIIAGRARSNGIDVYELSMRSDFDPVTIFQVFRIVKRGRYQVVLLNTDKELRFGGLAARLAGVTAVFPRHGIDHPLKNKHRYRFAYNVLAHRLVANSCATKRALLKNAPWLSGKRIVVIYNGIDPSRFWGSPKLNLRNELDIEKNVRILGFVGQLDERKGIKTLLDAFHRVTLIESSVCLVLVGVGPLAGAIREFCSQKNIEEKVKLLGFRDDIPEIMKNIDMLILPSLWEGFGIVLIEAMAAGKPCITTNVSSMPEIVLNGKTGFVVEVDNANALSAAILQLVRNSTLAKNFGEQGRHRVVEAFTLARQVDDLEALFANSLIESSNRFPEGLLP